MLHIRQTVNQIEWTLHRFKEFVFLCALVAKPEVCCGLHRAQCPDNATQNKCDTLLRNNHDYVATSTTNSCNLNCILECGDRVGLCCYCVLLNLFEVCL